MPRPVRIVVLAGCLLAAGCTPEGAVRATGEVAGAVGNAAALTGNAPLAAGAACLKMVCDIYSSGRPQ